MVEQQSAPAFGNRFNAIASNRFSQEAIANNIPSVQPSKVTSFPIPEPVKPQPKSTNKPSQSDINVVCDALK
jgi:hypothetical protein